MKGEFRTGKSSLRVGEKARAQGEFQTGKQPEEYKKTAVMADKAPQEQAENSR